MTAIGKRTKVSASYWLWFCGRKPFVGDVHISDGHEYRVKELDGDTVILVRRKVAR